MEENKLTSSQIILRTAIVFFITIWTLIFISGCASFQVSTLNYDPIYDTEGNEIEVNVINNEFELDRLLRTDFKFRYDFAQYAMRQPNYCQVIVGIIIMGGITIMVGIMGIEEEI